MRFGGDNLFRTIDDSEHSVRIFEYGLSAGLPMGKVIYKHGSVRLLVEASGHHITGSVLRFRKRWLYAIDIGDNAITDPYAAVVIAWDAIEALGLSDLDCTQDSLRSCAASQILQSRGCRRVNGSYYWTTPDGVALEINALEAWECLQTI